MTLAQGLTAVIVFWAVLGGIGAALLLPGMQSLIHGNFEGRGAEEGLRTGRRGRGDRGGSRSPGRRVAHHDALLAGGLPPGGGDHRGRAVGARAGEGRALLRSSRDRPGRGAARRCSAMGGLVLGILVWQEGGDRCWRLLRRGAVRAGSRLVAGSGAALVPGRPTLARPRLFRSAHFRLGISGQMLQQIALGRRDDHAADLPPDGAGVRRAPGRSLAGARSRLSMFAVSSLVGRKAAGRPPSRIIRPGASLLLPVGVLCRRRRTARGLGLGLLAAALGGDRVRASACSSPSSTTTPSRRSRRSGSARPRP